VSVLRSIEQKIEAIFEGVFGRAFRANVQPVELARKLVKEMDDHRLVSVSRVYVPNEYTVFLSPDDREQFASYEASLRAELQDYLVEHAHREGYAVLTPPVVLFKTDDDLDLGEFGIATRMVQPQRKKGADAFPDVEPGATMVYRAKQAGATEAASPADLGVEPEIVTLTIDGTRHAVDKRVVVIGRGKDCDIRVQDPNVSRRHAELHQEGTAYWVVDLGSTNGTEVNGRREQRAKLEDGDRILLGSTELVFGRAVAGSAGNK
jgi:hypothetical protein